MLYTSTFDPIGQVGSWEDTHHATVAKFVEGEGISLEQPTVSLKKKFKKRQYEEA